MDIEQEIHHIKDRNQRVEAEKAWKTSLTRKGAILILTYVLASIVMYIIGVPAPYLNAIIPTLGFFLSTLSIGWIKRIWLLKIFTKP
jgi:hypothetical protein